jgi:tetratricopeptide (TPR) repeat protein
LCFTGLTTANAAQTLDINSQQEKGVQLGREGKYQEGLAILQKILDKNPGNYAVRRDFVVIATWAGDCDLALKNYEKIKQAKHQEGYLIAAVSDCLNEQNRPEQAIALLEKGAKQSPDDDDIKQKLTELKKEHKLNTAKSLRVSLSNNNSDQGNQEWLFETRYSQQVLKDTRAYARLLVARADDPKFATGDLNRLGVGAIHHLNYKLSFDVELSTDVQSSGEEGITGTVLYQPHYLWELGAQHASFAEDLPLRAKAADVSSNRTSLFADFHSPDYRFEWSANASQYRFSDSNTRKSFSTTAGYAHYMTASLEHRLIVDFYRSSNTLPSGSVVYFNPGRDTAINLTHKSSLVYDSRFKRHVDNFFVYLGSYWQKDYDRKPVYGFGLQQEYNFTDTAYFTWGASYNSHVYDGRREREIGVFASYEQKF